MGERQPEMGGGKDRKWKLGIELKTGRGAAVYDDFQWSDDQISFRLDSISSFLPLEVGKIVFSLPS